MVFYNDLKKDEKATALKRRLQIVYAQVGSDAGARQLQLLNVYKTSGAIKISSTLAHTQWHTLLGLSIREIERGDKRQGQWKICSSCDWQLPANDGAA